MEDASNGPGKPEDPPEFHRRTVVSRSRLPGLVLLAAIPMLALFGLLGDRTRTRRAEAAGMRVTVEMPAEARYGDACRLRVLIEDDGAAARGETPLRVTVSEAYLEHFSGIRSQAEGIRATVGGIVVEPGADERGGHAPWVIELTPDERGRARGELRVTRPDGVEAMVPLETLVLP